jgi:hypothetical protein
MRGLRLCLAIACLSLIIALSPAWRPAGIFTVIDAKCNGYRLTKIVGVDSVNTLEFRACYRVI